MRHGGIAFVKAHACGNDFLIIDEALAEGQHVAMARQFCSRHTGVGADGIEFLERRPDGSFFLRLFNADGTEAELSGNGTRCVAAWLAESEARQQVELGTHGGVRPCRVVRHDVGHHGGERGDQDRVTWWIESSMGVPRVLPRAIRIEGVSGTIEGAMVNVGNPHFVLFPEADDFGSHGLSWQELGAKISADPLFRFGTNVEFVRLHKHEEIEFRIFERGCGPTTSSGTGTCASAAAAIRLRGASPRLTALAEGGAQQVCWLDSDAEMLLTGPAEIICAGEVRFA